jgi:DNA polymerase V
MELIPEEQVQCGIFDEVNRGRDKTMMKAIDKVNNAFGANIVRFARQGYSKKWKLRQMKLSPCYTTRIEDVLTIKI